MSPADFIHAEFAEGTRAEFSTRGPAESLTPSLSPLTGRDIEVGLLKSRWEQAQEGMGQVVLIVGDAGLGKSRLVQTIREVGPVAGDQEAAHSAAEPAVIELRCSERFQSTGFHPVTDYLQRVFEFAPEESPAARFDRLAQYLNDCGLARPEFVGLFAKLLFLSPDQRYPQSNLPPAREREETFRALREWLRAASVRRPVLFVVEDLHWIDASTLEFLEQFISEGLHDRILTVLTFRPEFRTPWPAMAHQTSLALNRLTRRQVAEMMLKTAGGELPDSLVTQVYERTGGLPLLVEEFSRIAGEFIASRRKCEIPSTLQELIAARLDGASTNREVVELAATLGREFRYDMLVAVAGGDEQTLQSELTKLENAEIVYRKGRPPRATYFFKHTLLEEAVRRNLEESRQHELHRQIAETMEKQFPQLAEAHPEVLAHHFTEAGQMEAATGYWLRAGRSSLGRFANVEAINHLNKGLALLRTLEESPERDARELELLGPLGTAYIAARGYAAPEVGPIFERARALTSGMEHTPQAFVMMRGHFAYHIVRGHFRLCADLAETGMQFAEELGDPGIIMEALFLQGITQFYRGDFPSARICFDHALVNYDNRARTAYWATETGEDSGVTHRCYLALAFWHLGFPDRARAMNLEADELARSLHHPFSLEYALHHTAWLYQHCRLGVRTQAAGEEQMRIAAEQGFVFWHATGGLYSAAGRLLRGQFEEGLAQFEKAMADYRATGAQLGLPYYLGLLGNALTEAGRFDEAHRALAEALRIAEENDERFHEAELHRLQGELHLASSNDHSAAAQCFQRAIDLARSQGSLAWELRATTSLARLLHHQDRQHQALAMLTAIFDPFKECFNLPDLADAAALLRDLGNEQMRDDIEAGIRYVRGCIPASMDGPVAVDWRYIPASTLGGDAIGYHWLDAEHLAFYLIDVTGHGLDSALLSTTIANVIRSGSLAGADMKRPDQVLAALNEAFQGSQHGSKYFTTWYGVYDMSARTLTYASGGHPAAVIIAPGAGEPIVLAATGSVMGIFPTAEFPSLALSVPSGSRFFLFSDGVFEVRRDHRPVWDLPACIAKMAALAGEEANSMEALLAHVRDLRGSPLLDDDFSLIEARFP